MFSDRQPFGAAPGRALDRFGAASYSAPGHLVARWVVACAGAIPVLMIGSWVLADVLQPPTYSPVRQSISVLAGQGGTDRWIVTTALLAVGGCYLALVIGLPWLAGGARPGLLVAGLSAIGIALCPEPEHGSTPQHLTFTALGAITIAVWPALVAGQAAMLSVLDRRMSAAAFVVFVGLLGWAFVESRAGSALGLAERVSSAAAICWPLIVITRLRQHGRDWAAVSSVRRAESPGVTTMATPLAAMPTVSGARNSYADLLRSVAIVSVVLGHWLASGVIRRDGRFVGVDALGVVSWGSWVTLVLQVVPVFFLVGGYANAASWVRHRAQGEPASVWVRARALRLLVPTSAYVALIVIAVVGGQLAGADPVELGQAAWGVALHLWFLAAYLVVLLCTPALHAAHRRWGLWVPLAMGVLATAIDVAVVGYGWHLIGWANYLLVWGTFHQLGFAWQDRTLMVRRRPVLLAAGGVLVLSGLIWWGPYPVSMVGVPGARIQNASPPSTALLAFGVAQVGIVLAGEAAITRWLARHPSTRSGISTAGHLTMPIYLWHMVPVVIVIEAGYPWIFGLPAVGSDQWWEQRPTWIAALALTLAIVLGLLAALRHEARRLRIPASTGGTDHTGRTGQPAVPLGVLAPGVAIAAAGIGLLAVNGFAPDGHLNVVSLVAVSIGLSLVAASGWAPPPGLRLAGRRRRVPDSAPNGQSDGAVSARR